ncbi:phage tail length tape measure family protein [Asaia krungthepensis]|uniref:Uncharacterized protein n=1 Tax=Asaia krungthepensis NRIC 0535 TaxID=1307925 RepID=A0ABQ0Q3B6_9PROT|nr:transglycosylase SLT domain-containing protein [Asaia krungthepensis]GBQ89288.1 hypothetical protein AA0535_1756 [Asaia krungthepensis NRIC 0535]
MPTTISELYIAFASNLAKAQEDAQSLTRLGDAAEVADTKVTRLGRSGVSVARQFDETTRAEAKLSSEIRQRTANIEALQKSLAAGEITQEQYAGSLAGIAKSAATQKEKFDAATGASKQHAVALAEGAEAAKLSSYQIGILAGEAHKFADQVLAGGGAMKAAFYQVPNMVTVMGGFGKATQIVTSLLMGPAGLVLATVAAGAAIYKLGSAANTEEGRLAALGQTLRATRGDYAAMAGAAEDAARRIAGKSSLSLTDSRAVTTTFAAMPSISGSSLDALATTARNLATVLGKDVPEAARDMAAAFDDPAKAAEDFAQKGLLGVHEGLVQHMRDLQASGDRIGAWTLLMGQVSKATANAADLGVTPLHRALHDMNTSIHEGLAPLGQFVDGIGNGISAGALKGVQGIQYLLDRAKEIRAWQWEQLDKIPAVHDYFQRREVAASDVAGVGKTIDRVGASMGAGSDVLALAHRIQPMESATGQYDAQGRVVQSSAGALGAMQIMPNSANGNDLRTTEGNVTAGVQLLMRLYAKYDGNQALVAMAYNWGEGNVDKYLSGKIASPPASVADYAQKATGGEVYGAQAVAARQGRVDDQLRGSDGSTAAQIREHEQAITALTTAQKALNDLHTAGKVSDADYTAQTGVLTDKINVQRGALNELRDPIETIAHQQKLAAQSAETYSAAETAMVQVHQQVEEAARRMGQAHATAAQLAEAEARQQAILTGQFNQSVATINERTQAEQDLLAGYDASKGSLTQYQQAMEAAEKVRATSTAGSVEQARQLDILTGAMKSATASQVDMANAGKLYGQSLDLEVIKAQTAAIGQNSDAVSVQIAVMKERNRILEAGGDINSKTSQAYLDNVAAIQMATNAYQHQKSALDDLTGSLSSMFDTLTNSVTQAFVQSGKGAVDFGSILAGLQTQIVGLVAKMALVNPALNALDGGSRKTIMSLSDSLASGGAVGNKAASVSIAGAGSTASGVTSSTGWLSKASNTKLFGSATVGNLIGGIGGGFGLGSALGNIGGGTYGTIGAGAGAAIGAGIGSFFPGGTAIGGLIGGGLGGLLGGLFGHKKNPYTIDQVVMEGDQFSMGQSWNQKQDDTITAQLKADMASLNATMASLGLKAENLYLGTVRDDPNNKDPSQRSVSLADLLGKVKLRSDDSATFSQALSQGMPETFDSVAAFQSAVTQLKAMAEMVDALGVAVSKFNSDGTVTVSGFTEATGDLRTALDTMLNGKTVATSDLQSQVATITEFVTNTMPNLMKATVNGQQSWVEQMEALKKTYEAAATQASGYGLDGNALNDKFSTLYEQGYAQNMQSLAESAQAFRVRYLTATGDDQGAALMSFDLSARQQKRQLAESWRDFLGEAYAGNATYLQQASDLEKTLGAERLAIQKQYADKAAEAAKQAADAARQEAERAAEQAKQQRDQAEGSAASVISGLLDFAKGLDLSSYSPLSAEAQYRAANDNFTALAAQAQSGDYEALQSMRGAAESLLAQSHSYNGSGRDFVSDYTRIQEMLRSIGSIKPDTITESALKAMLASNNQTLAELLQRLLDTANKQLTEQRHQAQSRAA